MILDNKILILSLIAVFFVSCRNENYKVNKTEFNPISVDGTEIQGDKAIEAFIKPYGDTVRMRLGKVLAYSKSDLLADRSGRNSETKLGDLLADLIHEQGSIRYADKFNDKFDFTVLNRGGIRTNVSKGDITLKHMFEIMPFENTLLVVTVSGEKMKEFVKYMIKSGGHPMSNIRFLIKNDTEYSITIGGEKFVDDKAYKILTTDYLQHGGDNMKFFDKPLDIDTLNYLMRDAMIDYFEKKDSIEVELDNRFDYVQ